MEAESFFVNLLVKAAKWPPLYVIRVGSIRVQKFERSEKFQIALLAFGIVRCFYAIIVYDTVLEKVPMQY